MPLYIGIDGGGSKTACVLGDENSVLASSRSAGSNVIRLGEKYAAASLQSAISQACCTAQVSPLKVQAACVGASGAGRPEVQEQIRALLGSILPRSSVRVIGDNEIAHEAALLGRPGVVVIAGTGSVAYGRNQRGETARAGGYGLAVSDEGSGQWIGREAIAKALRAGNTSLLTAAMRHWQLSSQEALIQFVNRSPAPDFSSLFPLLLSAARTGEAMAKSVLQAAGCELATLTDNVLRQLWREGDPVRVGLVGGVFANSPEVRLAFLLTLRECWPTTAVSFQIADPVLGALSIARQM
ncbi:MAG TPA: BadF/BadG/BcrA/BcrD ATPase family protein [Terriglobales bacterium]|nr:BadF/BadG/BcrA/BcrD ATPase family protein [Terriglobales bacterium]